MDILPLGLAPLPMSAALVCSGLMILAMRRQRDRLARCLLPRLP